MAIFLKSTGRSKPFMKAKTHVLYILCIVVLGLSYWNKGPTEAEKSSEVKQVLNAQSFEEAPKMYWTYGVDYDQLIPLQKVYEEEPKLEAFIDKINKIFHEKNWMSIIDISSPAHYREQGEFLGSDSLYVTNNINVHPYWKNRVVIENQLFVDSLSGFEALNQIQKLEIIGRETEAYSENAYRYFGYLQKENGKILAIYFMIVNRDGEYQLTGAVG